ncbi:MAG TPA: citrate synthase [Pseudonocardiaceae bacterium]|nr:citrate synthase [Pseudonocardiaceae bacterium]
MAETDYLTTAQVAQRLGVKPDTVYAYVSRGLLTSIRLGGARGSRFASDEVEAVANRVGGRHTPVGSLERIHTRLTLLDRDRLYYRGRDAVELAGTHSFESVARWLWTAELTDATTFSAPDELVEMVRAALRPLPVTARLTDQVRMAAAALGAADPLRFDLSGPAVVRGAEHLLAVITEALPTHPGAAEPGGPRLAQRLWPKLTARPPVRAHVELLNAVLVLMADHDLAVSTLAARVAASARADVYAVVSAGLGALDGRYHGASVGLAYRFLRDALDNPVAAIADRLRADEHLPGFGHRVYTRQDPRAELILARLGDLARGDARVAAVLDTVTAVRAELTRRVDTFVNVDLTLAALVHALDLRPDAGELIFGLARVAGWVAHAIEEFREPGLRFRATGVYTGPRPF